MRHNYPAVFTYTKRIGFFDVDSMGIVWHGHYVKYLEEARCAWLRALGYTYLDVAEHGEVWPIVQVQLKYMHPATFDREILVHLYLEDYESSLKLHYLIQDKLSGERLCEASTRQMVVRQKDNETRFETPPEWQQLVRHYVENLHV